MTNERKKERWTEMDVLHLPSGEHDYFERKSGALLSNNTLHHELAKALSAFANSGGGHILLGVKDDSIIDGVPQTMKGRTTTRDWLEQSIPNLVIYPLHNFRVHEVVAATPSVIPAGQVVIVIDVGNSELAPHQCAHNKVYYYRAGGRSEPAHHFYLQMLSKRDVYPGPTIAKAWLETVINPILMRLRNEQVYLTNGKWTWAIHGQSLQELASLRTFGHDDLSLNLEQILEDQPHLTELVAEHDEAVATLRAAIAASFEAVKESVALMAVCEEIFSVEALAAVKEKYAPQFSHYNSAEEVLGSLFGSRTNEAERRAYLAQEIINQREHLPQSMSYHPIWNTHQATLRAILTEPALQTKMANVAQWKSTLSQANENLAVGLKAFRKELATRFRIPYASGENPAPARNQTFWA